MHVPESLWIFKCLDIKNSDNSERQVGIEIRIVLQKRSDLTFLETALLELYYAYYAYYCRKKLQGIQYNLMVFYQRNS